MVTEKWHFNRQVDMGSEATWKQNCKLSSVPEQESRSGKDTEE